MTWPLTKWYKRSKSSKWDKITIEERPSEHSASLANVADQNDPETEGPIVLIMAVTVEVHRGSCVVRRYTPKERTMRNTRKLTLD